MIYLVVALIWRLGDHVNITKLNVCHLDCKHGHTVLKTANLKSHQKLLKSKSPNFDPPLIPCIRYI